MKWKKQIGISHEKLLILFATFSERMVFLFRLTSFESFPSISSWLLNKLH